MTQEKEIAEILILERKILIPTTKIIRGIDIAKAASQHSDACTDGKRLGAALFAGSRLVSIGFNMYSKSRPSNVFKKNGRDYYKSVHAEQNAVLKYNRHYTNHSSLSNQISYYNNLVGCHPNWGACRYLL